LNRELDKSIQKQDKMEKKRNKKEKEKTVKTEFRHKMSVIASNAVEDEVEGKFGSKFLKKV
jgi:hypothetical protein